ncbi:cyclic-phosphate processing receiver domain-containing protein [Tsukamurella hominis]|uniref:cyclic-phosphate processing receiver domain-containing protein n=1 Tax=Tsukamurella hominis TaxID=1970232 RepID=UPI0039E8CD27
MKLFVDDLRDPPDATWTVARTSAEALAILQTGAQVDELSLDHDLGGEDTSRPIVLHLAEHGGWPATVRVHSANPVGVEWLVGMIERYGPGVTR